MLEQLLWKRNKKGKLYGAFAGTLIGFFLLLGALQFYVDINSVFSKNEDLINPEYLIINKEVSFLNSLSLNNSQFAQEEIDEIKRMTDLGITNVSGFISSDFKVGAFTRSSGAIPAFYTHVFFEAIPDQYLDIENEAWKWKEGDDFIPVVIPRDYLNLYNFGFAQSRGLPQISPKMVSMANFSIRIQNSKDEMVFKGKIVDLSDRINSILVPYDFLKWANKRFGTKEGSAPSRLVLVTKDPSNSELSHFLEQKGYQTNADKLKNSKLSVLLKILLSVVGVIALIIISLALIIFILAFQNIINRSSEKLRTLVHIGYCYKQLSKLYIRIFIKIIIAINIISILLLFLIKSKTDTILSAAGFEASSFSFIPILTGIVLSLGIVILNSWIIQKQIKKLA